MTDIPTSTKPGASPGIFVLPSDQGEGKAMAELADALKNLAAITPRLNAATDGANAVFRATEEFLGQVGIGIESSRLVRDLKTEVERDEDEQLVTREDSLYLVYERITASYGIGFQIEHRTLIDEEPTEQVLDDPIHWSQAPRLWKLEGVVLLPALIESIAQEAEGLVAYAEVATKAVKALMRDLEQM